MDILFLHSKYVHIACVSQAVTASCVCCSPATKRVRQRARKCQRPLLPRRSAACMPTATMCGSRGASRTPTQPMSTRTAKRTAVTMPSLSTMRSWWSIMWPVQGRLSLDSPPLFDAVCVCLGFGRSRWMFHWLANPTVLFCQLWKLGEKMWSCGKGQASWAARYRPAMLDQW